MHNALSLNSALLAAAIASLVAIPRPADAIVLNYNSMATFSAATGSSSLVDFTGTSFDGLTPSGANLWIANSPAGFSLGGATFSIPSGQLYIIAPALSPAFYDRGTGNILHADIGRPITISFSTPINAFALDLSSFQSRAGTVTLSFTNGDASTAILGNPLAFNGYISDSSFSAVTIGGLAGQYLIVDNIRYANILPAASVPEPANLALFGFGLAVLAARRLRA